VYLPHVGEEAGAADAWVPGPGGDAAHDGSETVLVAEDEPLVRAVTREILTRRGYTVLAAEDGPSAIAAVRHHGGPIDLLVTDVVMPGMSGPELAALLGAERPALRVLFTSGYADHEVLGRGVSTDGLAFVPKPFTPEGLARRVREVLDAGRATMPAEPPPAEAARRAGGGRGLSGAAVSRRATAGQPLTAARGSSPSRTSAGRVLHCQPA
jgi:CheY-like chemotaxis protein